MYRRSIVRERLTGKVRGKRQFLTGKFILQVEVQFETRSAMPLCPPPPNCKDPEGWIRKEAARRAQSWQVVHTYYRDARSTEIADIQTSVAA